MKYSVNQTLGVVFVSKWDTGKTRSGVDKLEGNCSYSGVPYGFGGGN